MHKMSLAPVTAIAATLRWLVSPPEKTRYEAPVAAVAGSRVGTDIDGFPLPEGELNLNAVELEGGGEWLALPWRRFDEDLRDVGQEGFKLCGRRLVIGDVSNSSEGTGLFTWDGAVLLAKYLEHQAVAMRHDFRNQRPCHQTQQCPHIPDAAENEGNAINAIGDGANLTNSTSGSRWRSVRSAPIRVLELGCGTGLAGLAAAFAFGRRLSGDNGGGEGTSPSPIRPRHSWEGEGDGVVSCAPPFPHGEVEVVLTDLEYALTNARANISLNSSSLKAVRGNVEVMELDWCCPLPKRLVEDEAFDLILAADVVWLDDLVTPLVRTLERLTARWSSSGSNEELPESLAPPKGIQEQCPPETDLLLEAHLESGVPKERQHVVAPGSPPMMRSRLRRPRPRIGRRVVLAYQWRSERTGKALLEALDAAFRVREIPPEECHPKYLPSSNLCLLEAVRREG